MPAISWITFREKVVGRGSPAYLDVDNRPLRQIVELHGWNADDIDFAGLHHFPVGAFADDISEHTPGHGVNIHDDVTFVSGKYTFTSSDDFNIHLGTHQLKIDNGDIHLTNGVFFGTISFGRINDRLEIGLAPYLLTADSRYNHTNYAELYVGDTGRLVHDSDYSAYIKILEIGTEQIGTLSGPYPFSQAIIGGHSFLSYIPSGVGFGWDDTLLYYFASAQTYFMREDGATPVMRYDGVNHALQFLDRMEFKDQSTSGAVMVTPFGGIYQWDGATETGAIHKVLDQPETGWSLGSAGSTKGGLNASTATTSQVAAVVNALVSALMSHHKLLSS